MRGFEHALFPADVGYDIIYMYDRAGRGAAQISAIYVILAILGCVLLLLGT